MAEADIAIVRIAPETSFKNKAYDALKEAILKMDIYATPEQVMLDERALSERLGVSRTPIREAIAMLEQDGFVKTVPRRGIVVVRRTKTEIVDMIRAWAALESMAARLITTTARKKDITALRDFFKNFGKDHLPQDHVDEYSKANIAFHQALISLSESPVLVDMTNDILLHVRGYRQLTIGRTDRTAASLPELRGRGRSHPDLSQTRSGPTGVSPAPRAASSSGPDSYPTIARPGKHSPVHRVNAFHTASRSIASAPKTFEIPTTSSSRLSTPPATTVPSTAPLMIEIFGSSRRAGTNSLMTSLAPAHACSHSVSVGMLTTVDQITR